MKNWSDIFWETLFLNENNLDVDIQIASDIYQSIPNTVAIESKDTSAKACHIYVIPLDVTDYTIAISSTFGQR